MQLSIAKSFQLLLVVSILVASTTLLVRDAALATETTVLIEDGAWWKTLDLSQKLAAVQGMQVGYAAAYQSALSAASLALVTYSLGFKCISVCDSDKKLAKIKSTDRSALVAFGKRLPSPGVPFVNAMVGAAQSQAADLTFRSFGTTVERLDAVFQNPKLDRVGVAEFFECAAAEASCATVLKRFL